MIHRDAIRNSSKLETREITIRQINCGIYSHSGILYRNKNEWTTPIWHHMNES